MWLFPSSAALVSALFATLVLRSWAVRRGPHLVAWGVALAMFAVASLSAGIGMLAGWNEGLFRAYYLFGAIVNVPFLALGTIYLLTPRKVAHVCTAAVVVLSVGAAVDVFEVSVNVAALATNGIPPASEVLPESIRTLSRIFSFSGFFVVVGGAVWSAIRLVRQRGPHLRRLASANLLIALGTTVTATASGFARYQRGSIFSVGLLVGVSLMFFGFLRTRPRPGAP
jgi:hypothetical protein